MALHEGSGGRVPGCGECLCVHDQSCSSPANTGRSLRHFQRHAFGVASIRRILQPTVRAHRHIVGRAVPCISRHYGLLPLELPSLHRSQSGPSWNRRGSLHLSLVQPPVLRDGRRQFAGDSTSGDQRAGECKNFPSHGVSCPLLVAPRRRRVRSHQEGQHF